MSEVVTVTRQLLSAPLPQIIERLGIAVADAQLALDKNSVGTAAAMASTEVDVGGKSYNLLALGFSPTFYSFTEATVEAKLSFSMTEETNFEVKAGANVKVTVGIAVVGATVDVTYARKFSVSSDGTSSIAARLVSLPPPERLEQLLRQLVPAPN